MEIINTFAKLDLVVLLLAVSINAVLAIFVYKNNSKSATNIIFALLSFITIAWLTVAYVSLLPQFLSTSLIWIKLSVFFAVPMGLLLFLLAHTLPHKDLQIGKRLLYALIFIGAVVMIINISPYTFTGVEIVGNSPNPTPGPGLIPFIIFSLFTSGGSIYLLIRKVMFSAGLAKQQIRLVTFGILLMLGLIIVTIMIPVAFLRSNIFVPLAPLYSLIFLGMTAYAIIRHKLFDIRLIVARAVAYVLLATILFASYIFATVLGTSIFFGASTKIGQLVLYSVLTLIAAYSFQPLRTLLENATDKIFYRGKYDSSELLSSLTKIMATTLRLDQLTERLLIKILPEMRISKGAFVLLEKGKVESVKNVGFYKKTNFVGTDVLALLETGKVQLTDEVGNKKIKKILRELDATVSVPLVVGNDELGILLLGHKLSGEIYTDQDIKVLDILSPEISIAIQNAKAFEEISKFNVTLQKEIEKATVELRGANEKLKELDKLKDEFMSIASHELRTPMTAIKSFVWLSLHGKSQEKQPKVREYLQKVYDSSERMINMINDMLNVSRIETGRLQLEIIPVPIFKVATQVKEDLLPRAQEMGIEIVINQDSGIPAVLSDKDKLTEIFTNLIGNSIKFTKKGGKVTVSAQRANNMVEVSITDTGVGISQENMTKLFKKYGRIGESYATVSPSTGTGLGLYITKQYLEKMDGGISVKSTLGKGTTFTFSLPVATGRITHKEEEEKPQGIIFNPKFLEQLKGNANPKPAPTKKQK
jgi:signal transduction histidine kinase